MTTRTKIWLFPAFLYGVFVFWYTPTGGPLSDSEVNNFIAKMEQNGSAPEAIVMIRQFGEEDTGKHFIMINNIDYNETPGDVAGAAPGRKCTATHGPLHGAHDPGNALTRVTSGHVGPSRLPQHGCDWCRRCRNMGYGRFGALPKSSRLPRDCHGSGV